jgi:hypothetical protein
VLACLEGRRADPAPPVRAACPHVCPVLAAAIDSCLHPDPEARPRAGVVAALLR